MCSTKSKGGGKQEDPELKKQRCITGERRRDVAGQQLHSRPKEKEPDGKGGWEGFKRESPGKEKS